MEHFNHTIIVNMGEAKCFIHALTRQNLVSLRRGLKESIEMSQQIFVEHYNLSVFQITGNGIFLYLDSTSAKFSFSNARVSFGALGV